MSDPMVDREGVSSFQELMESQCVSRGQNKGDRAQDKQVLRGLAKNFALYPKSHGWLGTVVPAFLRMVEDHSREGTVEME